MEINTVFSKDNIETIDFIRIINVLNITLFFAMSLSRYIHNVYIATIIILIKNLLLVFEIKCNI